MFTSVSTVQAEVEAAELLGDAQLPVGVVVLALDVAVADVGGEGRDPRTGVMSAGFSLPGDIVSAAKHPVIAGFKLQAYRAAVLRLIRRNLIAQNSTLSFRNAQDAFDKNQNPS